MPPGGTAMLLFIIFTSVLTTDVSALSCDWSAGLNKLEGYIPGNPSTVSVTNGDGECRNQCMSQTDFICAAVNYKVSDGVCELLAENNQTASVVEPVDGSWLYFIRPLCAGMWLPWTTEKGKRITGGNSFSDSTTNNLQDCMTSCVRDPSGGDECRAVNIHTSSDNNNCKLRPLRVGEENASVTNNLNWQYFNRPIWYLDSSMTSTPAGIRDQGTIGYFLHIFTALTIPASGYLVAWQYYMKAIRPRPTYVSLWRPNDDASIYTLISNTLLAPEEPSTEGVRFQYIQNETIRVQQHDVLSIHAALLGEMGGKSIVSVNTSEGSETTVTIENKKKLDINTTRSLTTNPRLSTTLRIATPALKAYVSAYLSLDGMPKTYRNTSLSPGQIWLKLSPLTTEQSVVVAGYKVLCSTEINLSPLVPCYDGLVPVNSRDVLLNLPDVTRTYHVSVQIARNFNGAELLDTNYPAVSTAFCVERSKTDQVIVSESNVTSVNPKPVVTVSFQHVFHVDDMCAKEMKLNYSGYDGEYKTIDNNPQREYILQLEQGSTYELAIYLKLADGSEVIFWTQEYTTSSVTTTTSSTSTTTTKSNGASDKTEGIDSTAGETAKSYFKEYKTYQAAVIGVGVVAVLGIACSVAFTIHCIIRKRRLASAADEGETEMQMKETGKVSRQDKTKGLQVAELPSRYEVVHSPPAGTSNEYERVDLPSEVKTGEYEAVGTSHPHAYEGLSRR